MPTVYTNCLNCGNVGERGRAGARGAHLVHGLGLGGGLVCFPAPPLQLLVCLVLRVIRLVLLLVHALHLQRLQGMVTERVWRHKLHQGMLIRSSLLQRLQRKGPSADDIQHVSQACSHGLLDRVTESV